MRVTPNPKSNLMLDVAATAAGMIAAAAMMILVKKPIVDGPEVRPVGSQRQAKSGSSHGGRLIYDTTQRIKLQGELGCDRVKPSGDAARSLIKLTIAPTHAWAGPGFWSRPEVRNRRHADPQGVQGAPVDRQQTLDGTRLPRAGPRALLCGQDDDRGRRREEGHRGNVQRSLAGL